MLDYQVLATYNGEDGAPRQKVLLVAAQKDMVRQFVEVAKKAGLSVEGIDLQAFALVAGARPKASFLGDGESANGDGTVALANIGSGVTNLIVSVHGIPQFTRVINIGSDTLVAGVDDQPRDRAGRGRSPAHRRSVSPATATTTPRSSRSRR